MEDKIEIKRKGLFGIMYFLGNSAYSAFLGLIANLVFTIYLSPAEYGLYFIVLSIIMIFSYFTDLGLAASLVQSKNPKEEEFHTAFTIQLTLVTTIVIVGLLLTPIIIKLYSFTSPGISLYLGMIFSLFILSFKSIPSTRLERQLAYSKIVLTQVVESTTFYAISIILLLAGFKIYALTFAVIARSFVGTSLIYYFTRWVPKFTFNKKYAKRILSYGIPFQSNVLLAFVKDDLLNLFLASQLGLGAMGYVGWAKKWAETPLKIIMDNVNRVLFPIFSKFQDNKERLALMIEKVVFFSSLILMPILAGAFFTMPYMIVIIPKYIKWETALTSFNFFLLSTLFVSFTSPFINVFNAIGKVRTSVKFMLLWIALNWTVVPLMIFKFGFTGVSIAFAFNSLSFILVILKLKDYVNFQFLKAIRAPLLSTSVMSLVIYIIQQILLLKPWTELLVTATVGVCVYSTMIYILTKGKFIPEIINTLKVRAD
jgi:O-antigen/teichoic acid export membrane protein